MEERNSWPATGARPITEPLGDSASSSSRESGTNGGIVDRVRQSATAQLSSQKDKATEGLGSVASAVRQTTQTLREQHHDTVAQYVEQAADQIERVSRRLKEKDVGELLDDAQRLARRQPALFIGGAFAVGLLGARFLKSSSQRAHHDSYRYDRDRTSGSYASTSERFPTASSRPIDTPTSAGTTFGSTGQARNRERF